MRRVDEQPALPEPTPNEARGAYPYELTEGQVAALPIEAQVCMFALTRGLPADALKAAGLPTLPEIIKRHSQAAELRSLSKDLKEANYLDDGPVLTDKGRSFLEEKIAHTLGVDVVTLIEKREGPAQ